jgi:hypothetical protein
MMNSIDNQGLDYLKNLSLNKVSKENSTISNNFNNVSVSHPIATDRSHMTGNFNQTDLSMILEDNQHQSRVTSNLPQVQMITSHTHKKNYSTSERIEILSKPKIQYHGKDFFNRQDFRGLFLADHQEAIGDAAFKCVDKINSETVSQFNQIPLFRDSIQQKQEIHSFYKNSALGDHSYRNKATTSIPSKRNNFIFIKGDPNFTKTTNRLIYKQK